MNYEISSSLARLSLVLPLAVVLVCSDASAQQQPAPTDPGYSRIQGQSTTGSLAAPPTGVGALIDYRQEMRTFIERLSTYAREQNRNFSIIIRDANELVIKRDVQDENIISPARTLMHSIDGVMFEGMFVGHRVIGQPPPPEVDAVNKDRLARIKRTGLNVFSIEFAADKNAVDEALAEADKLGVVTTVVPRATDELTGIPNYPKRPHKENPNNILSVQDIKNFVYISDPAAFGRQDQFALSVQGTNFDLVIVDPFSGREPLSKRAVETLKYKKLGAKRMVFARMDLGTAASYRFYWQPNWHEGNPSWIGAPYPGDPDRYFVDYWTPGWQNLMFGNPQSFVYGLIAQGYDGVVLEGLRTYLAFEGNVEVPVEFAPLATAPN